MLSKRIREAGPYKRVKAFARRYERWLMPSMLIGGTVLDAVQFRVLSIESTFMITGAYALLCAVAMIVMATPVREEQGTMRYLRLAAPFVQQFTIGALLSTALLFYWFSGALSASWPVVGAFALLMVFNELFRKIFIRPTVQVGVFYFALFALFATVSAYALNSFDSWVFVSGGVASLLVMAIFLALLFRIEGIARAKKKIWATVLSIFVVMNGVYFLNYIPPIPLSLREAGVYTSVTLENGEYVLVGKEETWLGRMIPGQTLDIEFGQPLYAFTSVYAPADLSTTVVHRWQRDDEEQGWVTTDTLSFEIQGGRQAGYRGYSRKTTLTPGQWRVSVETERGQVLGRINFKIK